MTDPKDLENWRRTVGENGETWNENVDAVLETTIGGMKRKRKKKPEIEKMKVDDQLHPNEASRRIDWAATLAPNCHYIMWYLMDAKQFESFHQLLFGSNIPFEYLQLTSLEPLLGARLKTLHILIPNSICFAYVYWKHGTDEFKGLIYIFYSSKCLMVTITCQSIIYFSRYVLRKFIFPTRRTGITTKHYCINWQSFWKQIKVWWLVIAHSCISPY